MLQSIAIVKLQSKLNSSVQVWQGVDFVFPLSQEQEQEQQEQQQIASSRSDLQSGFDNHNTCMSQNFFI